MADALAPATVLDEELTTQTVTVPGETPDDASPDPDTALAEKRAAYLKLAYKRFQFSQQATSEWRAIAKKDQEFAAGRVGQDQTSKQWNEKAMQERISDARPTLTINRQPQFIRQVTNSERQNKPSISVIPYDSKADPATAEAIQGLTRQIENASDADIAYSTAGEHQATIGLGFIGVTAEFVADDSFDLDLKVRRFPNPFCHYWDPASEEFTGKDARFWFIVDRIANDEYEAITGKKPPASADFAQMGLETYVGDWMPGEFTLIAEYWHVDLVRDTLQRLSDGSTRFASDPTPIPEGLTVMKERTVERRRVKSSIITGADILEGNADLTDGRPWPGSSIPFVPVKGTELNLNGKWDWRGIPRDAKDSQEGFNYSVSALLEKIALASKAPYLVDYRSIKNHRAMWENANRKTYAALYFDGLDATTGQNLPSPQRLPADSTDIQATILAVQQFDSGLKDTTGMYNPTLGERGPQQSGKAILALQRQAEVGANHYADNLSRAVRELGRKIVELIPAFYDAARIVRILGVDGQPKTVMLHAGAENAPPDPAGALQQMGTSEQDEQVSGVQHIFDVGAGRYDVNITTGPSYQTLRQEGVASAMQFINAYPAAAPLIGDIIAEEADWPGGRKIAKRLRKALPPGIKEPEQGEPPQLPPEVQAEMQKAQQVIDDLTAQLDAMTQAHEQQAQKLATEERIAFEDRKSKELIAWIQAKTSLLATDAKLSSQEAQAQIRAALDELRIHIDTLAQDTDPGPPAPSASSPQPTTPAAAPLPIPPGQPDALAGPPSA